MDADTFSVWTTITGTPISIILGIASIVVAGKAKKAAEQAKEATLKRLEEKKKETLYGNYMEKLSNLSNDFQDWENELNNCNNIGRIANKKTIVASTSTLINNLDKESDFCDEPQINKIIDEIKNHHSELLQNTDKNKDFVEISAPQKKLTDIIKEMKSSLNTMTKTLSKKKDELGL